MSRQENGSGDIFSDSGAWDTYSHSWLFVISNLSIIYINLNSASRGLGFWGFGVLGFWGLRGVKEF